MTVLQGPILYLHFSLTYKTELFSKKVQKVVQNGVQKRGPPDELCNAQILVFACFFSVPEFRDTEFCQSTAGCIDASGRQMPVHKINKKCHRQTDRHTQTDTSVFKHGPNVKSASRKNMLHRVNTNRRCCANTSVFLLGYVPMSKKIRYVEIPKSDIPNVFLTYLTFFAHT